MRLETWGAGDQRPAVCAVVNPERRGGNRSFTNRWKIASVAPTRSS